MSPYPSRLLSIRCLHAAFFAAALLFGAAARAQASADPAAPFTGERLATELAQALSAHFNLDGTLEVHLLRPWISPAGEARSWAVAITEFPIAPSATMLVRFRLAADGRPGDDTTLMVHAALWRDAWFARQPLAAHSTFNPELLETRKIDSFREHDGLPASAGDSSFIFTRDVPAERMITWHDIARRPLVRKGEVVDVVASEGSLLLTMKALALENGARGDLINVRNLESRKDISALVVDDSRVQVHF